MGTSRLTYPHREKNWTEKRRLAAPQAASFSQQEWLAHLARPGSQGGCAARDRPLGPFPVHCGDCWLTRNILSRLKTSRHWLSATRDTLTQRTPRSWHVSQGLFVSRKNGKVDSARKAYYSHNSGVWSSTAGSGSMRQTVAIVDAENKQLLNIEFCGKRYRAAKKNLTSTHHDLTNAFARGVQEWLTIQRLWQMWCERKYRTSQHANTFVSDLQVHSYGSNVWKRHTPRRHGGRRLVFAALLHQN